VAVLDEHRGVLAMSVGRCDNYGRLTDAGIRKLGHGAQDGSGRADLGGDTPRAIFVGISERH
jgi:hypothetical protein